MDKDKFNIRTTGPVIGQCIGDNQHVSMSFSNDSAHGKQDVRCDFTLSAEVLQNIPSSKHQELFDEMQKMIDKYTKGKGGY